MSLGGRRALQLGTRYLEKISLEDLDPKLRRANLN